MAVAAIVALAAFNLLAETMPPLPSGAFTYAVIPDTQSYDGEGRHTKRGRAPGVGNCILGNAFFGLANPVRFNKNPFLSGVIAGNWFDGCAAINVLEDAKRPHRAYNNVFVK